MMASSIAYIELLVALAAGPSAFASTSVPRESVTVTGAGAIHSNVLMPDASEHDGHLTLMRRVQREVEPSALIGEYDADESKVENADLPEVIAAVRHSQAASQHAYVPQPDREFNMLAEEEQAVPIVPNGTTRAELTEEWAAAHADRFIGENVLSSNVILGSVAACQAKTTNSTCSLSPGCKWHGNVQAANACSANDQTTCQGNAKCSWNSTTCLDKACFSRGCYRFIDSQQCAGSAMCVWESSTKVCKAKQCSDMNTSTWCASNTMCRYNENLAKCKPKDCSQVVVHKLCDTNQHCKKETTLKTKTCKAKTCNGLAQASCLGSTGCYWNEDECQPCFELSSSSTCAAATHCTWNTSHSKCHNNCGLYLTSATCPSTFRQACKWNELNSLCEDTCQNTLSNDKCNDYKQEQCAEGSLASYLQEKCPLLCRSCAIPCHLYNNVTCGSSPSCSWNTALLKCRIICSQLTTNSTCTAQSHCQYNSTAKTCGDQTSSSSSLGEDEPLGEEIIGGWKHTLVGSDRGHGGGVIVQVASEVSQEPQGHQHHEGSHAHGAHHGDHAQHMHHPKQNKKAIHHRNGHHRKVHHPKKTHGSSHLHSNHHVSSHHSTHRGHHKDSHSQIDHAGSSAAKSSRAHASKHRLSHQGHEAAPDGGKKKHVSEANHQKGHAKHSPAHKKKKHDLQRSSSKDLFHQFKKLHDAANSTATSDAHSAAQEATAPSDAGQGGDSDESPSDEEDRK